MDDTQLEALLERWNAGDSEAAEEVVLACEPYLRMIVRRRISDRARAKFDSVDIVQSVWVDVVRGLRQQQPKFSSAGHLRNYLNQAARHRLYDRLRQHRAALDAEQPLATDEADAARVSPQPRPSEVVHADDLWQRIQSLCPPAHRTILELKRQGLPLAEIAARSGLHEGSVRRILYDLAKRVAVLPDAGPGNGS